MQHLEGHRLLAKLQHNVVRLPVNKGVLEELASVHKRLFVGARGRQLAPRLVAILIAQHLRYDSVVQHQVQQEVVNGMSLAALWRLQAIVDAALSQVAS